MKLIVDSGSTKMHLCLLAPDGVVRDFELPGVNALTATEAELRQVFSSLDLPPLQAVYFYGAGVTSPAVADKVKTALPRANTVEVEGDLLAAARALFGTRCGVACILGTGSNTGLYDGKEIIANVPPLGYILGDEASGANIAIRFLRALYRDEVDLPLRRLFETETGLTYADVLDRVYRCARANAFLASLVPFIRCHSGEFPLLQELIEGAFADFWRKVVKKYDCNDVALTGGVASAFESELRKTCPSDISIISIEPRPMAGLVKFHSDL